MLWSERAGGLVAGERGIQAVPSCSQVSARYVVPWTPPNRTIRSRAGSYAIAAPARLAGDAPPAPTQVVPSYAQRSAAQTLSKTPSKRTRLRVASYVRTIRGLVDGRLPGATASQLVPSYSHVSPR